MRKRSTSRKPRKFLQMKGRNRFKPLTDREIFALGGRGNLLEFEERDYPFVQRMAMYMPEKYIAGVFGVSESTFHRMKRRDPRLVMALEKGAADGVATVGRSLAQMANSKKYPGCTIFYMKTKGGMRETVNVQATQVPADEDAVLEGLRKLEPAALRRIAQELASVEDSDSRKGESIPAARQSSTTH